MSGERQQASSFLPETDSAEHVQKNSAKIVKKLTKIKYGLPRENGTCRGGAADKGGN